MGFESRSAQGRSGASSVRRVPARKAAPAPFLSVIVPAHNEELRLGRGLRQIQQYLRSRRCDAEVIVVDDGSTDKTAAIAQAYAEWFPELTILRHSSNRGKGAAVRSGMARARGSIVIFTDADLSAPIEEADRLLQALADGAVVAVASRCAAQARVECPQPAVRRVAGAVFRWLASRLVPTGVRDPQCGLKAFRRDAAHDLARCSRVDRWAFDLELLALARNRGWRIAEVGVRWLDDRGSRLSLLTAAPAMLFELWSIRRRCRRMEL